MSLAIVVTLLTFVVQPMAASRDKEEVQPMVAHPPCPGGLERVEFENCKCNAGEMCLYISAENVSSGSFSRGAPMLACPYFSSQSRANDAQNDAQQPRMYTTRMYTTISRRMSEDVHARIQWGGEADPRVDDRFRADCNLIGHFQCSCVQTVPQSTSGGRPNLVNVANEAEAKRAKRADEIQLDEVKVEMHLAMLPSRLRSTLKDVLQCPISQQFMADPVIAADGHTYERSSIESWFRSKGKPVSPITHTDLANDKVIKNWAVRKILQDFSAA